MEVDVVVDSRRAEALCNKLSRRLHDGTPRLRSLVDQLLEAEAERFHGHGTRWRKLSPNTARIDAAQGRDRRPLVVTGALMRSLTSPGAPGQIVRATATTLTFGTRIYYARFHQRGEGVPRRTVVGLTRVQRQSVLAELRELLMEDL